MCSSQYRIRLSLPPAPSKTSTCGHRDLISPASSPISSQANHVSWSPIFILLAFYIIDLRSRETENWQRSFIFYFTSKIPTITRVGSDRNQEPGTQSGSFKSLPKTKYLSHHLRPSGVRLNRCGARAHIQVLQHGVWASQAVFELLGPPSVPCRTFIGLIMYRADLGRCFWLPPEEVKWHGIREVSV